MGVGAEWLYGVDVVVYVVSSACHGDPGVTGGDHMGACVSGKDKHSCPEYNHWPP